MKGTKKILKRLAKGDREVERMVELVDDLVPLVPEGGHGIAPVQLGHGGPQSVTPTLVAQTTWGVDTRGAWGRGGPDHGGQTTGVIWFAGGPEAPAGPSGAAAVPRQESA